MPGSSEGGIVAAVETFRPDAVDAPRHQMHSLPSATPERPAEILT
jgi:hypothetical protein